MKLIIMGPQGSGKGTQAQLLAEHYGIVHVAAGDLFRQHIAEKTAIGAIAAKLINNGKMVPDKVTDRMIKERIEEEDADEGWILDGYPRNLHQAEYLDQDNPPDAVIMLDVPESVSIARITKRRVCSKCQGVYGIVVQPKKPGICDKCGGKLVHRDDDKPEAIKRRLEYYHEETDPLIEYYKPRDIVYRINGDRDVDAIFEEITRILG
ncbi:adenylate kinase [Candidatus Woesearchaeota archaeon]|nr:adenylate kinase [Candidatus Woesearchaeota archaeon]